MNISLNEVFRALLSATQIQLFPTIKPSEFSFTTSDTSWIFNGEEVNKTQQTVQVQYLNQKGSAQNSFNVFLYVSRERPLYSELGLSPKLRLRCCDLPAQARVAEPSFARAPLAVPGTHLTAVQSK